VDAVITLEFNLDMAALTAAEFMGLLNDRLALKEFVGWI